jgi:tetratricopeptide (TPR) repeat protein
MEAVLEAREAVLGPKHPSVARSLHNLGLTLPRPERAAEAVELLRRAVDIDEVALSVDSPTRIGKLLNLGAVLVEMGELDEGRLHVEEAMAMLDGVAHPPERFVIQGHKILAGERLAVGDRDAAIAHLLEAWELALSRGASASMGLPDVEQQLRFAVEGGDGPR